MDNSVLLTSASTLLNYPTVLWSVLVANFGTIPALIISGLLVVGVIIATKSTISYLYGKLRGLFCKKEVSLLPQTYVQCSE